LQAHADRMTREARLLRKLHLGAEHEHGVFFPPHAFEIESIGVLKREVFGPVLHVVRYAADKLDKVCEAINATGYGLTLGIHSRIEETAQFIRSRVRVGNIYVNRNQIGAVVGVQPFGGEGLSGTGPKAGGPHYLLRFALERTYTVNTAAAGGNAALLSAD
jgi:RHH-type proline utilization regulon transcriptional repressor/proline dehydrogenase/delta 1-pyrroline-5-carboxylate dehydrogenase